MSATRILLLVAATLLLTACPTYELPSARLPKCESGDWFSVATTLRGDSAFVTFVCAHPIKVSAR